MALRVVSVDMLMRTVGGHLRFVTVALVVSVFAGLASPASAQVPFDVMTFNIRTAIGRDGDDAWPNRKDLVGETIERFAPHVVGLQEALGEQVVYLASVLYRYPSDHYPVVARLEIR